MARAESPSTAAGINAPLGDVDAEELEKRYLDEYKVPLHIMLTPDDRLRGRVYRELKTKQHTFVKVRATMTAGARCQSTVARGNRSTAVIS